MIWQSSSRIESRSPAGVTDEKTVQQLLPRRRDAEFLEHKDDGSESAFH